MVFMSSPTMCSASAALPPLPHTRAPCRPPRSWTPGARRRRRCRLSTGREGRVAGKQMGEHLCFGKRRAVHHRAPLLAKYRTNVLVDPFFEGPEGRAIARGPQFAHLGLGEILVFLPDLLRHVDEPDVGCPSQAGEHGPAEVKPCPGHPRAAVEQARRPYPRPGSGSVTSTASPTNMKSRRCSPSAIPSRYDLNSDSWPVRPISSYALTTTERMSGLWSSYGPKTLKYLRPTIRSKSRLCSAHRFENMLGVAVHVERRQALGDAVIIAETRPTRRHMWPRSRRK